MNDRGQIRPRLTTEELAFISYALFVLEQSAQHKLGELESLPYALKRFAKFIWYSGDLKALRVFRPYRRYVLCEMPKLMDFVKVVHNAQVLQRRFKGLLHGKKLHSRERWRR